MRLSQTRLLLRVSLQAQAVWYCMMFWVTMRQSLCFQAPSTSSSLDFFLSLLMSKTHQSLTYQKCCFRYLIDSRWFKQWKKYVGFDSWDMYNVGERSLYPGPIDNSGLFSGKTGIFKRQIIWCVFALETCTLIRWMHRKFISNSFDFIFFSIKTKRLRPWKSTL